MNEGKVEASKFRAYRYSGWIFILSFVLILITMGFTQNTGLLLRQRIGLFLITSPVIASFVLVIIDAFDKKILPSSQYSLGNRIRIAIGGLMEGDPLKSIFTLYMS